MKTLTMIVPCFNEADVLPMFYKEIKRVFAEISDYDCSLLFVNDGSKDKTLEILRFLAERDKSVKYISFSRNFGKEAAMLAGMRSADADYIGVIDADLQHSPDLIGPMLEAVDKEGYDVAASSRSDREGEARFKSFLSASFYKVINKVSDVQINDNALDFRIMRRKVVEAIVSMPEKIRFLKGIYSWVGFNVKWFPHENRVRAAGETKWSIRKLAKYAIDGILGYTSSPLRLPLWLGVFSCFAGTVLFLYGFIRMCVSQIWGGLLYVMLLAAVLFMGGLILFSIGIVGEYIARIYTESKQRPNYIISETNVGADPVPVREETPEASQ